MESNQVAQNITRAYLLLREYHEEVAGIMASCRRLLTTEKPPLAPIVNKGRSNDAVYVRPLAQDHGQPGDWLPRSIADFYAEGMAVDSEEPAAMPRRIACVWFTVWDDAADTEPHVTLGVVDLLKGNASSLAPHQLCSELYRTRLFWQNGWEAPDRWHGPRPIEMRVRQTTLSLQYRLRWFPFRQMLEGEPDGAVRSLIVAPLVAEVRRG